MKILQGKEGITNMFFFQVKKMKNFASGSATQVVDNNISYGKCCQDVDEVQMIFSYLEFVRLLIVR
jgi:hypothetical protein